jgi:transposase InsO family protein
MLVVTDYFSKWVEPLAIKNQEAETVASALINEFIARYGCPTSIYSDRGAQFTSRLVKIICDRLHIQKVNTCPYRPSSNGQCERSNRSLIDALSKVIQNEKNGTNCYLSLVCTIGRVPIELLVFLQRFLLWDEISDYQWM